MNDKGSYVLVFVMTFIIVAVLTVVVSKIFDRTPSLTVNGASGAPPFPNAYPQLPPQPVAPGEGGPQCVNFCTDVNTGKLVPCATTKLQTCTTGNECLDCDAEQPYQKITCQDPGTSWPTVAKDQAALQNKASKYCLPTKEGCIFHDSPTECMNDSDCIRCTDALPNGDVFACQPVKSGTTLNIVNAAGQTKQFTNVSGGKYCLPTYRGCDPRYGTATWTSNEGWKCVCKFPGVMGGPECNQMVACRADEVTSWSKAKQSLLLNMPAVNGDRVGDPWTIDAGVDPNKCVDEQGVQVDRVGGKCPAGTQPTVACQCDGIQEATRATYMHSSTDPLTCNLDPCYANVNAGRTSSKPLPSIPRQPQTTCMCSGAESRLWQYSSVQAETGGYTWRGYCTDHQIPNSKILIKGTPDGNDLCKDAPNTRADQTQLVPGLKPPLAGSSTPDLYVNSCVADPCAGDYSDPLYRTSQSIGYFDAKSGLCTCFKESDTIVAPMVLPDTCDRVQNPVCSYCQDSCGSQSLDEVCPVYPGYKASACGYRRCITTPEGKRSCDCGVDCFFYAGMCYPKVISLDRCSGLNKVPGVCSKENDGCHVVQGRSWSGSKAACYDTEEAVVCFNHSECGSSGCAGLGPGKMESCGGKYAPRFKDTGINLFGDKKTDQ
jgi:hypothetical protein